MHPLRFKAEVLFHRAAAFAGVRPATRLHAPFVPPVAGRMAGMLRAGDHDTLRFTLKHLHPDARPAAIEAMIDILDADERCDRWIDRLRVWYRESREFHATVACLHGLVRYAWQKRRRDETGLAPAYCGEVCQDACIDAVRLLDEALAEQPENVGLRCLSLAVARTCGEPVAVSFERFARLRALAPLHVPGHHAMLENLDPRWGGSDVAQLEFAREHAVAAPDGHPLCALAARAELRRYLRLGAAADPGAESFFPDPAVAADVEAGWRRSVASPAFREETWRDELNNLFAAMLYLTGKAAHASLALAALEGTCLAEPWQALALTPREAAHPGWVVDRVMAALAMSEEDSGA